MQLPTLSTASDTFTAPSEITAELAAAMLDTLAAADPRLTIAGLERLLAALRPAAEVRRQLACLPTGTLQAALQIRAQRSTASGTSRPA